MEISYGTIKSWFEHYFEAFNTHAGPFSGLAVMREFFTPDLEFWSYVMPGKKPVSREDLLMTMLHPGLHEHLTPREYAIDLNKMIVVVQIQVQISDLSSGKVWPAKQASAHYHIILDSNKNIVIKKIFFFMEQRPPEEGTYRELWVKYRNQALAEKKL